MCYALQRYNWTPPYAIDSCDDETQYFYTVLLKLLDEYLPYVRVTKYTGDKPWVTQQFKDLTSRPQRALLARNHQQYSKLSVRKLLVGGDPFYLKFWVKLIALERNRRFSIYFRS